MVNVIKLFRRNYATIGIIILKIIIEYTDSSVNYAEKSFIKLVPKHVIHADCNVLKVSFVELVPML